MLFHTSGHQYILFYFLFQIMVNKKHGKQNWKSVEFSLRTIKICRFKIIDGVKYFYCIKHAYKFLLRKQVDFAAVLWRLRQCVSSFFARCLSETPISCPISWGFVTLLLPLNHCLQLNKKLPSTPSSPLMNFEWVVLQTKDPKVVQEENQIKWIVKW